MNPLLIHVYVSDPAEFWKILVFFVLNSNGHIFFLFKIYFGMFKIDFQDQHMKRFKCVYLLNNSYGY